jgi:hypothetical protein
MPDIDRIVEEAFDVYLQTRAPKGHVERVARELASGCASRAQIRSALAEDYAFAREDLLDLVMYFIGSCITDHELTPAEVRAVVRLRRLLGLEEGDLFSLRRREVEELVERELSRLLADGRLDPHGARYQAALQEVLGLGYDEWLKLTRPAVSRIVRASLDELRGASAPTDRDRRAFLDRLFALDTVYVLSQEESDIVLGRRGAESQTPDLRSEKLN